jgi:hypothetical protein
MRPILFSLLCLALVPPMFAADDEPGDDAQRITIKQALEHMQGFEMRLPQRDVVPLVEKPLLTFGDSARANLNGTLWAFGDSGRPLAILELYQPQGAAENWVHAVSLTSSAEVVMKGHPAVNWSPETTQIKFEKAPDAPAPAAKQGQRTRQIKDLARRFSAHEFWDPDNSRFELRLLVQPVHRYENAAAGVQDGAIFAFAHGTNPEVLLLVESHGKSIDESHWTYGLVRLGSAEMHVALDDSPVWTVGRTPGVVGQPKDPYWLFLTPSDTSVPQ